MNSNSPQWHAIPAVALNQIYDYLDFGSRLSASSTCFHWRQCVFQKRYFNCHPFKLNLAQDDQLSFFHQRMANLVKEVIIIFDLIDSFHIQKIRRLLYKVARCDNIQALRFQTHNVGLIPAGDIGGDQTIDINHCFVEPIKLFLNRKRMPCQLLDLGAIEALTYYGQDFLRALGKPQELIQLTLASIKYDPSLYPILTIDTTLLQKCAALQVLSLDYDSLNDEVLHTLQVLPLRKLLITVHGLDPDHAGISETAWHTFSTHFNKDKDLELYLTFVYAYEAIEMLQQRILRINMPVTHVRMLFCEFMNTSALQWMSVHNSDTLRSIHYIDSASKRISYPNNGIITDQDPFIMLAWRCKQLQEIIIHGYVMDPLNLVGIARLRCRQLRRFDVSMINWTTSTPIDELTKEICTLLGQQWLPLDLTMLHPALDDGPMNFEMRDNFVYQQLRKDLNE